MILGLDISTSIVGAAVINNDGGLVFVAGWDLSKCENSYEKAETVGLLAPTVGRRPLRRLGDIGDADLGEIEPPGVSGFDAAVAQFSDGHFEFEAPEGLGD